MQEDLEGLADPGSGWRRLEAVEPEALLAEAERLLGLLPEGSLAPLPIPTGRDDPAVDPARAALWTWLEATRRVPFLRRIAGRPEGDRWLALVLEILDRTHFTLGPLLRQRARRDPERTWLRILRRDRIDALPLATCARIARVVLRGLNTLFPSPPAGRPVALLAENSPESVFCDLACLTGGLVNVTIPADATGEQAAWICEQTESEVLIVGSDQQYEKMLPLLPDLSAVRWVVRILPGGPPAPPRADRGFRVLSLEEVMARGEEEPEPAWAIGRAGPRMEDPATLMFTSGTTGQPKGIVFSHRNLVSKRFARALALPEIGEEDHFLCYLPLYHTFGRWLELTGSLFWGATYTFMENPSLEALLDNLRRAQPTVFISIPKKWIQLHEHLAAEMAEEPDPLGARAIFERVTGGRLRWGLSAAGYLDPAIFRFFQRNGLDLLSGFGMTEGTGGITMTPPGAYREGTVGRALPGVEIARAEDGELLVRGPYIMQGYFGPDEGVHDHRVEWLHTGDIVELDGDGYVTLVDRKKDIYKNVRGQTVAPQRVESLFQGIGEIRQTFLVGDGREYNTLLLLPDYDFASPPLREMTAEGLREYLSSIVVSVNGFLAPFERVLDFAILPRPIDLEHGELTPKGTYRRKVVEEHFADLIGEMYRARATRLRAGPCKVVFPHWWLREMGLTLGDLTADESGLRLPRLGRELPLSWDAKTGRLRCGDLRYDAPGPKVDLEVMLRTPALWLGNHRLVRFMGSSSFYRPRRRGQEPGEEALRVAGIAGTTPLSSEEQQRLADARWREDRSLATLHLVAVALQSAEEREALRLVAFLESVAAEEDAARSEAARIPLRRATTHPLAEVRASSFRALLQQGAPEMVGATMTAFLEIDPAVLNAEGAEALSRRGLPDDVMQAFLAFVFQVQRARAARRAGARAPATLDERRTLAVLGFLVRYAGDHPAWFQAARYELARWQLSEETQRIRDFARRALQRLTAEFRAWLGPDPRVAVDPVTGREYGWAQVLRFEPGCDPADARRLVAALSGAPILKEAIFILSGGARASLTEIPEGGVRIRHLGTRYGKAVYRLSVQTRHAGSFEIAIDLASGMAPPAMEEEVLWLISLSTQDGSRRLVEEVGGFWPEHALWTEEYVPGETVARLLDREASVPGGSERLIPLWVHLAGTACTLYVDLWERTGRRFVSDDPAPESLIVPAHDYQEGARLVSVSERRPFLGLPAFLRSLRSGLIERIEARHPALSGVVGGEVLFAALVDVLGEGEGAAVLEALREDPEFARALPAETETLQAFLESLRAGHYLPRRLAAAVRRYQRWAEANPTATPAAAAHTLRDLWDSYALTEVLAVRPETRLRFFRETVFAKAPAALRAGLDRLVAEARSGYPAFENLLREVAELIRRETPSEEQRYFLARMTYWHLRPEETPDLALIEAGGIRQTDVVVTLRDRAGRDFRVRHAASPREVGALHRLFYSSGIKIRFRSGHQFLVAVDESHRVLGGLVYIQGGPDSVHMEKIVVAPSHRRQGISEGLMEDFFRRLRARGVHAVTTGFFRPQYFRLFRFKVDREHAGLVRILDLEPVPAASADEDDAAVPADQDEAAASADPEAAAPREAERSE